MKQPCPLLREVEGKKAPLKKGGWGDQTRWWVRWVNIF